jgi:hypothetical protein
VPTWALSARAVAWPTTVARSCVTWRCCSPTGATASATLAGLRDQAGLFGRVCSTPTAWRVVGQVAADPRGVAGLWSALARVRTRAWAAGAAPQGSLRLDLDATLLDAHSDKQGAAGPFKHGFGFHPLVCWLDRGDGTGEALAGILREATPAPTPPKTTLT